MSSPASQKKDMVGIVTNHTENTIKKDK